ncbi:MAG TPA: hypothetical protein VD931_03600 [Baekduia sp.]|nr:hypothetical protein [Baekduia sp.]
MPMQPGSRIGDKDPEMNQRPPDPQEDASLPLETKDGARRSLSNPVREPDMTSDADPYAPAPDDERVRDDGQR